MGVEVKGLLFLIHKEIQNLNEYLADLRIKLYMVFTFLANLNGEESQTAFYFLIAFLSQVGFHGVETVEELEEADEAANNFDFEEALFLNFVLEHVVVLLGCFHHYVHYLFYVKGNLQVLLLDLHEHP